MNTKRLTLFLFLALWLGACGTIISVENLEIRIPTRAAIPTLSATPSIVPSLTSVPTVTATASPTAILSLSAVTTANVNFRIAPSTDNTPILVVLTGTRVTLVGRNSDASWLRTILADGRQGWMFWQNLSINGNRFDLPVITVQATATPTIDPTPTQERPKSRIGYNINGLTAMDRPYLLQHMTNLCSSALVMDNLVLADEIYRILAACDSSPPIVVHRSYDSDEGSEWAVEPSSENINQWNREGYKHLIRYCVNEPSYGGNQSVEQFVNYHVQLMASARANGITLACGNFAVGSFRWEDIAAGRYDPFLRAINDYGHYLACHEYTQTVLPFGVSQWPREYLLDRTLVQPANWPTASQLPTAMQFDPVIRNMNYPRYYHLRRCDWFLLRADQIGIPRPRIILTEYGWDSLADIKPTIEPLRWQFGLPQYMNDLRGVNTYARLWGWYYPNWSFGRAACEQLKWGDSIYPEEYVAFHLFTWTQHPHWLHTDMSGIENGGMFELHRCLEDYANR